MMDLEIGRLLRAGSAGFVVGCRVAQLDSPSFGALIRVPLEGDYQIYGLIHDIHIDDDGLVRQLVTAENVEESIIADNRQNRNVPIEVSVMTVGYREGGRIYHLLPPRPALSLDTIYLCDERELCEFTGVGRFGYFRHVLLAAHLKQARQAHLSCGNAGWFDAATQELITILRDDYAALMSVLSAISDL
jgi:hypothetical protein